MCVHYLVLPDKSIYLYTATDTDGVIPMHACYGTDHVYVFIHIHIHIYIYIYIYVRVCVQISTLRCNPLLTPYLVLYSCRSPVRKSARSMRASLAAYKASIPQFVSMVHPIGLTRRFDCHQQQATS